MTPIQLPSRRWRAAAICGQVLLALLPCMASTQSVPKAVEQQLLAARDTIWHAWFSHDTTVLNRMLPRASAAGETNASGAIAWSDRAAIVGGAKAFATGGRRLERVDFSGTRISLDKSVAVVTSNYTAITRSATRTDTSRGHATEVFVRDGARWVNPFWRLEPIDAADTREIPLPDTLGANFAIADSATKTGTEADYDTFVGTWQFRFQNRNTNGSFSPAFRGHWSFEKMPGGHLIEDHWRADNPGAPMGVSTYTYRVFDPGTNRWFMMGTNSSVGEVELGTTWSAAGERFAVQHYGPVVMRIRYISIEPNHFLWRADRSTDGGLTWTRDTWTMEATRIGK